MFMFYVLSSRSQKKMFTGKRLGGMSYSRFIMPMTIFDVKELAVRLPAISYNRNPISNHDHNPKPNPNR